MKKRISFLLAMLLTAGIAMSQTTLFTNVNIFDGNSQKLITGKDVLFESE